MKLFATQHLFFHPWNLVSAAHWVKYPNELTPHVVHVDYLNRSVDPETGILRTERILTCKQNFPDFILRLLGGHCEAYVHEISEINPKTQTLTLKTKNLTMSNMITVEETCIYTPFSEDTSKTTLKQYAQITSLNGLIWLRNKIEDFCLDRFSMNAHKGKVALETVLDKFVEETKEVYTHLTHFEPPSIILEEVSDLVQL